MAQLTPDFATFEKGWAEGRNQIDGPAAQIASDPVVGEIYLGGKRMEAS